MKVEIHDDDLRKEMGAMIEGEIRSIARSTIDASISSELDRRIKYKSEIEFDKRIEYILVDCVKDRLRKSYFHEDDTVIKICKELISVELAKIDIKDLLEKAIAKKLESCQLKVHI
jgi:hypothetical protein